MESGHNIRVVQKLMGHKDVEKTMICTHVMNNSLAALRSPAENPTHRPLPLHNGHRVEKPGQLLPVASRSCGVPEHNSAPSRQGRLSATPTPERNRATRPTPGGKDSIGVWISPSAS
ncbi:MAG: hypothetical protein IPI44_11890 [Sulfuritalea sp.]|nr:hypothetical protein [Sulfuritalea sp.]MBK8118522.1 hypothetical protein [Sulfuritalea sp.]